MLTTEDMKQNVISPKVEFEIYYHSQAASNKALNSS